MDFCCGCADLFIIIHYRTVKRHVQNHRTNQPVFPRLVMKLFGRMSHFQIYINIKTRGVHAKYAADAGRAGFAGATGFPVHSFFVGPALGLSPDDALASLEQRFDDAVDGAHQRVG